MPRVSWEQALTYTPGLEPADLEPVNAVMTPETADQSFLNVMSAAYRQNSFTNLAWKATTQKWLPREVEGYSFFNDPDAVAGVDPDDYRFYIGSTSPQETARITENLAVQRSDRETLSKAGGWGLAASMATVLTDVPTILSMMAPLAAPVTWGSRAQRVGAATGAVVAIDTAAETALLADQQLRTKTEAAVNIAAGAILSGLLGTLATRVPKSEFERLADNLNRELYPELQAPRPDVPGIEFSPARGADSGGAARVGQDTTLEEEGLAYGAQWVAKTFGKISPTLRLLSSSSREARRLVQDLTEVSGLIEKNRTRDLPTGGDASAQRLGVGSAEAFIKRRTMLSLREALATHDDGYLKYATRSKNEGQKALSKREFGIELSKAMRREDQSAIPEVAEAARRMRKMFEADKDEFIALGALPEDVEVLGAKSYFSRVYDHGAILQNSKAFKQMLFDWFWANPKVPKETPDIVKARPLAETADAVAAEYDAAKVARKTAEAAVEKARKDRTTAASKLREAENKVESTRQEIEALEARREDLLSEATGEVEDKIQRLVAQVDRQIERARVKGIKADEARQKLLDDAVEADNLINRLKADASKARQASKAAAKAAEEAKAARKIVDDFEALVANAKRPRDPGETDPVDIWEEVNKTYDNIMGINVGSADIRAITSPKMLKSRELDIPDSVLEPWLVSDFNQVMRGYVRGVAPNIEMRRMFGTVSPDEMIEKVRKDYSRMSDQYKGNDPEYPGKLDREFTEREKDIRGIWTRLMNQDGPRGKDANIAFVRAQRILRSWNYVTMLGGQTASSFSDAGRVVAQYGLGRTGKAMAKFLTDIEFNKMAREDAKRMGTALGYEMDRRTLTFADISEEIPGSGRLAAAERLGHQASQQFTRITLMSTWNSTIQNLTTLLEQDSILRLVSKPGTMKKLEKAKLRSRGLSDEYIERIGKQFAEHGEDADGLLRARTELWTDKEAAEKFEAMIVQAADVMTVSRSAGDIPLMMDKELVKTIFQFKSFGMSAVSRIMIPVSQGLAAGDAAAYSGLTVMLGLGGLTYATKEVAAGRVPDFSDPKTLIAEAMNWSGFFGYAPDILAIGAPLMPHPLDKVSFSRFSTQRPLDTALGPSFGKATDLFSAIMGVTGETSEYDTSPSITASDMHKIRKLLPGQNLVYLRRFIDAVEGETADLFNLEGAEHRSFGDRVTTLAPPED